MEQWMFRSSLLFAYLVLCPLIAGAAEPSAKAILTFKTTDERVLRCISQATGGKAHEQMIAMMFLKASDDVKAERNTEETRAFGDLVKGRDVKDPLVRTELVNKSKNIASATVLVADSKVEISSRGQTAADVAKAYAQAFVAYCNHQITGSLQQQIEQLDQLLQNTLSLKGALSRARTELMVSSGLDTLRGVDESKLENAKNSLDEESRLRILVVASEALFESKKAGGRREFASQPAIEEQVKLEEANDAVLQTYQREAEVARKTANNVLTALLKRIEERKSAIKSRTFSQIERASLGLRAMSDAQIQTELTKARSDLGLASKEIERIDPKLRKVLAAKKQSDDVEDQIAKLMQEYNSLYSTMMDAKTNAEKMQDIWISFEPAK